MWEGDHGSQHYRHLSSAWRGRMTLRASYLLSEHNDRISPTSTRINNINNERGSKDWVDFVSSKKKQRSVQWLTWCSIFQTSMMQTVSH